MNWDKFDEWMTKIAITLALPLAFYALILFFAKLGF